MTELSQRVLGAARFLNRKIYWASSFSGYRPLRIIRCLISKVLLCIGTECRGKHLALEAI